MRFLHLAAVALVLGSSATAYAHDDRNRDRFSAVEPERLMQGAIRESDVTLFLDYLRAAILAAAEGREPAPPPEELQRRAEELGTELGARGTLAALLALSALERQAKAFIRQDAPPAYRKSLLPTVPYTPVSSR